MRKFVLLLFLSLGVIATNSNELSFVFPSKYSLDKTVEKIQNSIKSANYRVYKPKKLLEKLSFKQDTSKQVVVRFCNFEQMYKFMQLEKRLGVVLPCRITIVENDRGEVSVVVENYKRTVARFNNPNISKGADVLIDELFEVIEDALW